MGNLIPVLWKIILEGCVLSVKFEQPLTFLTMPDNVNGGAMPQQEAVKPIWEVMYSNTDTLTPPANPAQQAQAQQQTQQPPVNQEQKPDSQQTQTPADTTQQTEKTETTPTTQGSESAELAFELKPEDIKNAPTLYPENSLQALAQDAGFKLEKEDKSEFIKSFKENFVPKTEVEKAAQVGREKYFSSLKPEIAAAFDMIEMGIPQEYALNPTAEYDALLAMDDAQLVRLGLEKTPGFTPEMVDAEMEDLIASGKVEHKARVAKISLSQERQQVLNKQSQLVQQYTEKQQQAVLQQKVEADNQFKEVLEKAQDFLGAKLTPEAKQTIWKKYQSGAYDNELNVAQNKLRSILQYEFGDKFHKKSLEKAQADAKEDEIRRLSNVPPKKETAGGAVEPVKIEKQGDGNFSNLPSTFSPASVTYT